MPYVNVPNDLSKIKTKIAFNLTRRQLICFGGAAAVGIPVYLLTRHALGGTGAMFLMIAIMLPAFFMAMYNPAAPSPYVTWACYDDRDGQRQYEWGHYGSDRAALEQDFAARVQEYQRLYNVDVRQVEAPGLYKYYSTQRPVDIGTFPKPSRNAPDEIVNYDQRVPVENGSFLAWGHLTYTRPLTKRQASDYELRPAPDNPDRPRSIREQMKTAARQAEADRGQAAPKKSAPDRGDR